ncbi:hypothetical protein [Chamaesiphon sp. OTE_20_metabat_361]|uniref:hypothetical protein n=1 Tax=Chamaesiphon sp. OTE_20_metabat_361 TaxID=2964689 RepID=UPI00286AB304|nr:hypothetical protein [Chamaesiphon sp. OTE_20_metabat_361]
MARSIEQVGQDLHHLQTASSNLGTELTAAYQSYFAALAPTLKQQSIQSCYYLCTNCYPDAFLKLNYNQRSQLLKTLQRVISNAIANLVVQIDSSARVDNDDEPTGELTSIPIMPIDWFATPTSLSTWQQNLESEIAHSLKEISYKVNLLLQQARIMPATIPKPILEASAQADRQGESNVNIPNLLSILIEQEPDEQEFEDSTSDRAIVSNGTDRSVSIALDAEGDDFPQIVQIHSVYLRLTEVEFSEVNVLSLRKNIDRIVDKVKLLRREYLQKQQELKIAEAESAWRNSWFES